MVLPTTFVFFRKDGFYPIEMPESECKNYDSYKAMAKSNAERNKGTIKVELLDGTILWEA